MSGVNQFKNANEMVKFIKGQCHDTEIWKKIQGAAMTFEDFHIAITNDTAQYSGFVLDYMLIESTAQRKEEEDWIVGFHFITTFEYLDKDEKKVKEAKRECFLGFNSAREIGALLEMDLIQNVTLLDKPH